MNANLIRLAAAGLCCVACALTAPAQNRSRTELFFPDLPGLVTLRCDLHLHTVFSDGSVWPDVRVEEAWRDGLDAIAVSDHVEYTPHQKDLPVRHGRSYEIAQASAQPLGLIVIRAAEITRGEPPGHVNALFLTNVSDLDRKDYRVALSNATAQGSFNFWNHPGWKQSDGKAVWYEEQGESLERGWLHGIEIVNGDGYESIPHQWALDKKLAIVGNSDAHGPIAFDYPAGNIRPMTLVFAAARTREALREALLARRTAVFSRGKLFGEAQYLEPLFQGSIQILNPEVRIRGKGSAILQVRNRSPLNFELRLNPKLPELDVPERIILAAGKVTALQVGCASDRVTGKQVIALPCRVLNLMAAPEKPLRTSFRVEVEYEPAN